MCWWGPGFSFSCGLEGFVLFASPGCAKPRQPAKLSSTFLGFAAACYGLGGVGMVLCVGYSLELTCARVLRHLNRDIEIHDS